VDWPADRSEVHLPALLASAFGISTSEARRSLGQGGVKLDGEAVANGSLDLPADDVDGKVLQLGKRRFARVRVR
jgi:tyrosyl-tRNA synthetase